MPVKLIDRDLGWSDWLAQVAKMHDARVKVGVLGDDGTYEGGPTVVEVAAIHEFGTENGVIPERSFLRAGFDEEAADLQLLADMYMQRILFAKSSVDDAMNALGSHLAAAIKKRIAAGIDPPNVESVMRRKARMGRTKKFFRRPARNLGEALAQVGALAAVKPLIDTGRLIGSITWEIET